MKVFIFWLVILTSAIAGCRVPYQAKENETVIILLRHAEKDTIGGNNPALSEAGKARAKKLQSVFPRLKPDLFYSTPYIRTRETLRPWANILEKEIIDYNPRNHIEFADQLKTLKGKTIVVSGHSNTIPMLVNLIINADKYQNLPDEEYGTIYVVTIKNGIPKEKLMKY